MTTEWVVERTPSERFPYRITLRRGGRLLLALRAKDKWPGPKGHVFCLRESEAPEDLAELAEEERVPVTALDRFGRRLALVLDRPVRKRCDFVFLTKRYRHKPGEYEQIFFRTQQGLKGHRARSRVNLFDTGGLTVLIDSAERYPWRFKDAETQRYRLPAGDYAVLHDERIAAVVERKTFDNLLTDIGQLQVLHQQLAELASWPHAALVVEARYSDFLDPKRLAGRWPATHTARVLAELAVEHPTLPIVYAGERKLANEWAAGFFRAVAARLAEPAPQAVAEAAAGYRGGSEGIDVSVRRAILHELPAAFRIADLEARFSGVPRARLRRVLHGLREEGRLERVGNGPAARWQRRA